MEEVFFNDKKNDNDKKDLGRNNDRENRMIEMDNKENIDIKQDEVLNVGNNNNQDGNKKDMQRAYEKNIEYDMSATKREVKMKEEDKYEMEKMRRWNLKIYLFNSQNGKTRSFHSIYNRRRLSS